MSVSSQGHRRRAVWRCLPPVRGRSLRVTRMSALLQTARRVRAAHESALALGQPAHVAFEIAAVTCRRADPQLSREAAERLALFYLDRCGEAA